MSKRTLFLAALLLLGAWALRLYRLDAQSIWWDEGISLHLATSGAAEIVRDRLNNIHPPLYFFLLKTWLALTGVSPFTGRYLSALAGLLQVALVFTAARYWGRRAGRSLPAAWLAAGLMFISPLSVIYSQEIRVYALLPVAYLLLLLLAHRVLMVQTTGTKPAPAGDSPLLLCSSAPLLSLALLAATEWLALHLHYIALFAVAWVAVWGAWVNWRRGDWPALRRWVGAHGLVALASLPWLVAVVANWAAVQAEAAAGTFTTEPVPLPFLFAQVWAFHLTGLAGSLRSEFVQVGAGIAALLGAGLLVATVARSRGRDLAGDAGPVTGLVAAHWAVPLLAGLMVWSVRSFSHPRYIVMFAALLVPLAALLIVAARGVPRRATAVLFAVTFVALNFWGLRQYFFDPDAAKPDMRGVARYLEATAAAGDLILIPDTDWSLPFEYGGPATVMMPGLDESGPATGALAAALDCSGDGPCARSGRVFAVDYPRGARDWQNRLPFELERRGYWHALGEFDDVRLREYRLDSSTPLLDCRMPGTAIAPAYFGPLALEGAVVEQGAAADTAVTIALCWRVGDAAESAYSASLVLRDSLTGERLAQADTSLLDPRGAPTPHWEPGDEVVTYHVLPLAPGTPPVPLTLSAGVYTDGQEGRHPVEAFGPSGASLGQLLSLGEVALSPPLLLALPYPTAAPELWERAVALAPGLNLLGARFSPGPYRPGQTIRAGLTWQAEAALPDLRPTLSLEQAGAVLAESTAAPVQERYPTDEWQPGQIVSEVRDLRVPGDVSGVATLALSVGEQRLVLGEVDIEGAAVEFAPPDAAVAVDALFDETIRLVGFNPPPESLDPSQPVPVTLYWQSQSGEIDTGYTVFVHLLADDGRLIAQSDAIPAAGARPTNEWLAGEYVTDAHQLAWRESGYRGPARLAVGLYDAATGERLLTAEGTDHFSLPVGLSVGPAP